MRYIEIDSDNKVIGEVRIDPNADQSVYDYVNNTPWVIHVDGDPWIEIGMTYDPKTGEFVSPKPNYLSQEDLIGFIQSGINNV